MNHAGNQSKVTANNNRNYLALKKKGGARASRWIDRSLDSRLFPYIKYVPLFLFALFKISSPDDAVRRLSPKCEYVFMRLNKTPMYGYTKFKKKMYLCIYTSTHSG